MPITVCLWEEPGSISSVLLAGGSNQIFLSFFQAEQSPSISPCTEMVSSQKRVCFYSWLQLFRFAHPCFHIRVGSFSGLAYKTVLCFPKLETLCAGRKPAGDAPSLVGKTVSVSLHVVLCFCVNKWLLASVFPGAPLVPKCCLSQNAAGSSSFLCLESCLQFVLPELPWS